MKIKGLLYASTALVFAAGVPHAQALDVYRFNLPAGSLLAVADAIAATAGAKVSFSQSNGLDVPVHGVSGTMTLDAALSTALAGSGWHLASDKNGVVVIAKNASGVNVIVVQGDHKSFTKTDSNLLTRTDTSLKDTPATVDEVPQAVLQSQNATSLQEALRNVPGVYFTPGSPNQASIGGDTTASTGTGSGGVTFTNGLRDASVADNAPTIDVDSIEVLKGPSAIVSGEEVDGGLINFVPKRATGTAPAQIGLGVGSGDEALGTVDVGGKITALPGLAWRFLGLDQAANTSSNAADRPRQYEVHPMIGYTSDRLKADFGLRFYDQHEALPAYGLYDSTSNTFPKSSEYFYPDNNTHTQSTQFTYNVEYTLVSTDALTTKIRIKGLVESADNGFQVLGAPSSYGPYEIYEPLSARTKDFQNSHYADIYNKFYTGPLEHQLIVASDFSDEKEATNTNLGGCYIPEPNFFGCTVFTSAAPPEATVLAGPYNHENVLLYGVVVQDQVNWERLHLLLALRKSWYADSYTPIGSGVTVQNKQNFLPSGGIAFDITPQVTAYFSYSKTFNPNRSSFLTISGQTLPAQLREQYEVGIHTEFFDKKLNVNSSVYTYNTSNSALQNPVNPEFFIPGPGQKSTGFEISGTGAITPMLNIVAGYSYTYVKNADGSPVQGVPRSLANLWLVKSFHIADKQTLDAGIGGNFNDGDLSENIFSYPYKYYAVGRYVLSVNAEIGYHFGTYDLNLTANDILNRTNYTPAIYNESTLEPGRSFRLVLNKTF